MVAIDGWEADSVYPSGHYVRTLGQIGDKNTETEVLLIENDINCQPFTPAVYQCVPRLPWVVTEVGEARLVQHRPFSFLCPPVPSHLCCSCCFTTETVLVPTRRTAMSPCERTFATSVFAALIRRAAETSTMLSTPASSQMATGSLGYTSRMSPSSWRCRPPLSCPQPPDLLSSKQP